jgi:hypothetical protein
MTAATLAAILFIIVFVRLSCPSFRSNANLDGGGSTVLNLSHDGTHATLHVAIEASANGQGMNRV